MATDTGLRIRGFEVHYEVSSRSGPFCFLRTPEMVPAPKPYAPTGAAYAQREIRTWTDAAGVARGEVSRGPWAYGPIDAAVGRLTQDEAEAIIAVRERITAERFPVATVATLATVAVPAMVEIDSACEAERTPLVPTAVLMGRPRRTCVECGSPVYGDHCTHCMEG